jgi:ribosome recycling factor
MSYNFSSLETKIEETEKWLLAELDKIRTGRASGSVLDDVTVDLYGSETPINQLGSIGNEGPRTLRIVVYNASQIDAVEKALQQAELGASIARDDSGLRLNFPELTEENRKQAHARAKEKLEEARVSLRAEREKVWGDIKDQEQKGDIGEDEKFRYKEKLEEHIKEASEKLQQILEKKKDQLEL